MGEVEVLGLKQAQSPQTEPKRTPPLDTSWGEKEETHERNREGIIREDISGGGVYLRNWEGAINTQILQQESTNKIEVQRDTFRVALTTSAGVGKMVSGRVDIKWQ